jgi:hypothetical protein
MDEGPDQPVPKILKILLILSETLPHFELVFP